MQHHRRNPGDHQADSERHISTNWDSLNVEQFKFMWRKVIHIPYLSMSAMAHSSTIYRFIRLFWTSMTTIAIRTIVARPLQFLSALSDQEKTIGIPQESQDRWHQLLPSSFTKCRFQIIGICWHRLINSLWAINSQLWPKSCSNRSVIYIFEFHQALFHLGLNSNLGKGFWRLQNKLQQCLAFIKAICEELILENWTRKLSWPPFKESQQRFDMLYRRRVLIRCWSQRPLN